MSTQMFYQCSPRPHVIIMPHYYFFPFLKYVGFLKKNSILQTIQSYLNLHSFIKHLQKGNTVHKRAYTHIVIFIILFIYLFDKRWQATYSIFDL